MDINNESNSSKNKKILAKCLMEIHNTIKKTIVIIKIY